MVKPSAPTWVRQEIPAHELRKGDNIVTSFDRATGRVLKSYPVKQIEQGHRCGGVHVNKRECWTAYVPVARKVFK